MSRSSPRAGTSGATLQWRSRRPVELTVAAKQPPAELFGSGSELEVNRLYWGDNLNVVGQLGEEFAGQVKLIYLDPPYDSGADYSSPITLRGAVRGAPKLEETQYSDIWAPGEYLQFMLARLTALRPLLADSGSLWLHCDHRRSHQLRLLLDEVFGESCFLNSIYWRSQVARGAKVKAHYLPNSVQVIHVYGKLPAETRKATYNQVPRLVSFSEAEAAREFLRDERGFFRTSDPGTYSFESLLQLHAEGRLYAPFGGEVVVDEAGRRVYGSKGGSVAIKYHLKAGRKHTFVAERALDNLWEDVPGLGTTPAESVAYPTQKTRALLERILRIGSDPGDLVLDPFSGSGTTAVVAAALGRRFIAIDENRAAVEVGKRRLVGPGSERATAGLAVYHSNTSTGFRGELEARAFLVRELSLRPLASGLWQAVPAGTERAQWVALLPVLREARLDDLEFIIAAVLHQQEAARVEPRALHLTVVGTADSMRLARQLEDGLRAKVAVSSRQATPVELEWLDSGPLLARRGPASLALSVSSGCVRIDAFAPPTLLAKLSTSGSDARADSDWRSLVDAVFVDFAFDGVTFRPSVVDVPVAGAFVRGEYALPPAAGRVQLRLIDVLSGVHDATLLVPDSSLQQESETQGQALALANQLT